MTCIWKSSSSENLQTFNGENPKFGEIYQLSAIPDNWERDWNIVVSYKTGLYVCGVGEYMEYFGCFVCSIAQLFNCAAIIKLDHSFKDVFFLYSLRIQCVYVQYTRSPTILIWAVYMSAKVMVNT